MGEGLNPIFRPIEKMGEQAYNDFNDYLLHYLNIDRLNVLKRVNIKRMNNTFKFRTSAFISS